MDRYYCCMTNCSNYKGRVGRLGKPVTLHKLPRDQAARRAWIRLISRKNWKPSDYTRVCSDHFAEVTGPDSQDRNKLPTEFLAQKQKTPLKASKTEVSQT